MTIKEKNKLDSTSPHVRSRSIFVQLGFNFSVQLIPDRVLMKAVLVRQGVKEVLLESAHKLISLEQVLVYLV